MSDELQPSKDESASESSSTVLVPIDEQTYLVLGGETAEFGEILPLEELLDPKNQQQLVTDAVAAASHALNIVGATSQGLTNAKGLVRLLPETLNALEKGGKVVQSAGQNLGIVRGPTGITHIMRWAPATGAQAATLLGSLGPAAAMAAISFQIAMLQRSIDRLAQNLADLRHYVEDEQLAGLLGDAKRLGILRKQALELGYVPESTLRELPVLNQTFGKAIEFSDIRIQRMLAEDVSKNPEKWLEKHATEFRRELIQNQIATASRFYSDLMKASAEVTSSENLGRLIAEDAKSQLEESRVATQDILLRSLRPLQHKKAAIAKSDKAQLRYEALQELPQTLNMPLPTVHISADVSPRIGEKYLEIAERIALQLAAGEEIRGLLFLPRHIIASTSTRNVVASNSELNYIRLDVSAQEVTLRGAEKDFWDWNAILKVGEKREKFRIEMYSQSKHSEIEAQRDAIRLFEVLSRSFTGMHHTIAGARNLAKDWPNTNADKGVLEQ